MTEVFAVDIGNGGCRGISTNTGKVMRFETVMAPLTNKRGLSAEDEIPTYSLVLNDGVYVFGLDDVVKHGKRDSIRRDNGMDRYGDRDYFAKMWAMIFNLFPMYWNTQSVLQLAGIVSVPISVYDQRDGEDNSMIEPILRDELCRQPVDLCDALGNRLTVYIAPEDLSIVPESTGALFHWGYDPVTFKRRDGVNTAGTVMMIDCGYETANVSLHENMLYMRDRSMTVRRGGMGVVARAIKTLAENQLRGADVTRVDRGMRAVAGIMPGQRKDVVVAPGLRINVQEVYDDQCEQVARKIATEVGTFYSEDPVSTCVISGGGALHLFDYLNDMLPFRQIVRINDPEDANVLGAFAMKQRSVSRKKNVPMA